jgi:hypothetical protein
MKKIHYNTSGTILVRDGLTILNQNGEKKLWRKNGMKIIKNHQKKN